MKTYNTVYDDAPAALATDLHRLAAGNLGDFQFPSRTPRVEGNRKSKREFDIELLDQTPFENPVSA